MNWMKRCTGERCPADMAIQTIGGPWKVPIIYFLFDGPMRFSALRQKLAPVTPKMLVQQLRDLERDGVVARRVFAQVPPRVEYSLTPRGRTLRPIIEAMCRWRPRSR